MGKGRHHSQERPVRSQPAAAGGRRPTRIAPDALEPGTGGDPPAGEAARQGGGPAAAARRGTPPLGGCGAAMARRQGTRSAARGAIVEKGRRPGQERSVRSQPAAAGGAAQPAWHLTRSSRAREAGPPAGEAARQGGGPAAAARR